MTYNVVVIEDEPQVAELLGLILRHSEIAVHTALDGRTGLALIRQLIPNLVVLDIMMPQMNGWDVYTTIRSDPALKNIPIIIESVLPERPERKLEFAASEIDHYFTKPFDTMRLRREVARMLGRDQLWPPPKPRSAKPSQASSVTGEIPTAAEPAAVPPAESQPPAAGGSEQPGPDSTRADPLPAAADAASAPAVKPPVEGNALSPAADTPPAAKNTPPIEGNTLPEAAERPPGAADKSPIDAEPSAAADAIAAPGLDAQTPSMENTQPDPAPGSVQSDATP